MRTALLVGLLLFAKFVSAQPLINYYEYWFDNNTNSVQAQNISPTTNLTVLNTIDVSALPVGYHTVTCRTRTTDNVFSSPFTHFFLKSSTGINYIEYWFDNDYANIYSQNIATTNLLNFSQLIDVGGLETGYHTFNCRVKTAGNIYSNVYSHSFLKTGDAVNANTIVGYRYWIDYNANTVVQNIISNPSTYIDFTDIANTANLDTGKHIFTCQFRYADSLWSAPYNKVFYKLGRPMLNSSNPTVGGNRGIATINVRGASFIENTKLFLTNSFNSDTIFSIDSLQQTAEDYSAIACKLNLINKPLGAYHVNVYVPFPFDTLMTLQNAFTIEQGTDLPLEVTYSGPLFGRVSTPGIITVTITNNNNNDRGIPFIGVRAFDGTFIGNTWAYTQAGYKQAAINANEEGKIEFVPLHGSVTKRFYATNTFGGVTPYSFLEVNEDLLNSFAFFNDTLYDAFINSSIYNGLLGYLASGIPSDSIHLRSSDYCTIVPDFIFSPACQRHDCCYGDGNACVGENSCSKSRLGCDISFLTDMYQLSINDFISNPIPQRLQFFQTMSIVYFFGVRLFGGGIDILNIHIPSLYECQPPPPEEPVEPCFNCPSEPFEFTFCNAPYVCVSPTFVGSHDPNDKTGPLGGGNEHFTNSNTVYPYAINFENTPTATAPAQTVLIIDTLDAAVYDLETFELGDILVGNKTVTVPPGLKNYTTEVDMYPYSNIKVKVNASISISGVVQWTFNSFDSYTGEPVTDPMAGFLPGNINAPEGQGTVFYTIRLKDNLPQGTLIKNDAFIYFDNNAPIVTNEWQNTLDNIPPVSNVNTLSPFTNDTIINLSWHGSDVGSAIDYYDIYYSKNYGPYKIWKYRTVDTTGVFKGQKDSVYCFYAVATDLANNKESKPGTPDACTQLVSVKEAKNNPNIKIYPNPAKDILYVEVLANKKMEALKLSLYTINGTEILIKQSEINSGKNIIQLNLDALNAGIYIVKGNSSELNFSKRIAVIK